MRLMLLQVLLKPDAGGGVRLPARLLALYSSLFDDMFQDMLQQQEEDEEQEGQQQQEPQVQHGRGTHNPCDERVST